jgi:hypothetical protein
MLETAMALIVGFAPRNRSKCAGRDLPSDETTPPHDGREFEYHIKSAQEEHQLARESELTKAYARGAS